MSTKIITKIENDFKISCPVKFDFGGFLKNINTIIINQKINNIDHPTNIACKKLLNINENLIF